VSNNSAPVMRANVNVQKLSSGSPVTDLRHRDLRAKILASPAQPVDLVEASPTKLTGRDYCCEAIFNGSKQIDFRIGRAHRHD